LNGYFSENRFVQQNELFIIAKLFGRTGNQGINLPDTIKELLQIWIFVLWTRHLYVILKY